MRLPSEFLFFLKINAKQVQKESGTAAVCKKHTKSNEYSEARATSSGSTAVLLCVAVTKSPPIVGLLLKFG